MIWAIRRIGLFLSPHMCALFSSHSYSHSFPALPRPLRIPQHLLIPPRILALLHRGPPKLYLHDFLIPILRKTPHLPILNLKNGSRPPYPPLAPRTSRPVKIIRSNSPPRPPRRKCFLNPLIRFPAVAPTRGIPQQNMTILCPRLVEPLDAEIRHALHDDGVRGGVIHGGLAAWEGGGRPEGAVWMADVADRGGACVFGGGVGDGHVFFCCGDVGLGGVRVCGVERLGFC